MIFKTNNDHIAFHNGAVAILDTDGVFYCIKRYHNYICCYNNITAEDIKNNTEDIEKVIITIKDPKMDICPICEANIKCTSSEMCIECRQKEQSKNIPSKEILEKLIYEKPFIQIGKMFGVSDNAVRKWCKKYGLPYRKSDINKEIKNINT